MRSRAIRAVITTAIVSATLVTAATGAAHAADPIEMKVAVVGGPSNILTMAMEKFVASLNELSGGKVAAKVYPNAQLGNPREAFALCQQGIIEIATESYANLVSLSTAFEALHLPYIFQTREQAYAAIDSPRVKAAINERLESDAGLKWFITFEIGTRKIGLVDKEVHVPSDLKGLKLRASQSPTEIAAVNAFGAAATTVDWPELYNSLKLKVVEGSSVPLAQFYASKHYENLSYIAEVDFQWYALIGVTSVKTWNSWPKEVQDWVTAASRAAEQWHRGEFAKQELDAREKIALSGVKIYGLTGKERAEWEKVGRSTWASSNAPKELIDLILEESRN